MTRKQAWIHGAAGVALAAMSGPALAQASVSYGRVTNVQMVSQENARAQTGGAIVGGALGASLGSGRSAGNRAMTGLGGAFAGQQITRMATNSQAFEYTILVGGSTIRMVTDRKLPRQVDSSKLEFLRRAIAPDSALAAGFPARRAA